MSKYKGIIIEQDPRCDTRFRITMPESAIDTTGLFANRQVPNFAASITGALGYVDLMKDLLKERAADEIRRTDALDWIRQHRFSVRARRFAVEHKGDNLRTVFLQAGQATPSYVNRHWRLGLSITFKERDKAMLFKMRWMDQPVKVAA